MSSSQTFEYVLNTMQEYYQQIAEMTNDNYDKNVVTECLELGISEIKNFIYDQQIRILNLFYKILSTDAGSIFLTQYKNFSVIAASKAEEFMKKITNRIMNETETELTRTIAKFTRVNVGVFLSHDMSYTFYMGDPEDDEYDEDTDEEDEEDYEYKRYILFDSCTDDEDEE